MAVLMACEFVNLALVDAIRGSLRADDANEVSALFDGLKEGFLTTFAKRARMAYCLNVFGPKTLEDLNLLRHIRNAFAHSRVPITFENEEVAAMCRHFNVMMIRTPEDERAFEQESARFWFLAACTFLHAGIKNAPLERYVPWTEPETLVARVPIDGLFMRDQSRFQTLALAFQYKMP